MYCAWDIPSYTWSFGLHSRAAQLAVGEHAQAKKKIARSARENRRREAGEVAVDRRELRILQIMPVGVKLGRMPQIAIVADQTLSSHSFVLCVSPVSVKSDRGVPGAIAAGRGRPSCLARRIIASVMPPPVEVPKIAMFCEGSAS